MTGPPGLDRGRFAMHVISLRHRIVLATKVLLPWIGLLVASAVIAALPAQGGVIVSGTGRTLVSGSGPSSVYHVVSARADLSITPSGTASLLTIILTNTSPQDTTDPSDVLSSFYFDIVKGKDRPTLTYASADGPLYKIKKNATDERYTYTPSPTVGVTGGFAPGAGTSDLRAFKSGDQTWQLKEMSLATAPFLGFGIGTVGNTGFGANGFTPDIVGTGNTMTNFSIARGADVEPNGNLNGAYLLRTSGTFTFLLSGSVRWSESDIRREGAFGFGTRPDGTVTVTPEPSALTLGLLGLGGVAAWRRTSLRGRRA